MSPEYLIFDKIVLEVTQQSSKQGAPATKEALWSGEQVSTYKGDSGSILHPTADF